MTDPGKARKTFFSQWGPPTLLCGMFVLFGVFAFIIASLKPGFSGIFDLFQHGAGYAFLAPIILGIVFWLFFFWQVRFEETYATIYYCTFFPVRIDYAEANRLAYFYKKYKKQEVPAAIHFYLRSGKAKSWNINLFSPQTALNIKNELEKRVAFPEKKRTIPDVELWANNVLRSSDAVKIIRVAAALITFSLGVWEMTGQLMWDKRIKTWDKVDGIILKNTTKRISDGKRTKVVADVEYKYTFKGKLYYGTKIVYDSDSFPDLNPGTKRQVIVDPENPQECAIMFWYRGYWGLIRWVKCVFLYLVSLGFAILFFRTVFQKKVNIPQTLKNYINTIPAERFYAARDIEQPAVALNNIELRQKMEYQNFRYGVIRQDVSKFTYIVWGVLMFLAVATSVFSPVCWITVIIIGFVVYSLYAPRMTVFDFQEKKFFCCKHFSPEKAEKMKALSFDKVDHLCCNTLFRGNKGQFIGVFAVTHDGYKLPLFKVTRKRLDLLFELLPELAEKMGHLPITY